MARRAAMLTLVAVLIWAACAFWNSAKPLPPGTHVSSLPARLAESQVDFIDDDMQRGATLARELDAIDRAEQVVVVDQCPLAQELAQRLLQRKRRRPNLKILLITDPRNQAYGGTAAQTLSILEATGIIVVRIRLSLLRDSNPLYSSLWRLTIGWWSSPFDEPAPLAALRNRNAKADQRQLLVADDGAGGWTSIILSGSLDGSRATGPVSLEVRGLLAHDIVASEVQMASWSTDDDRFPAAPPMMSRGVGSIDARFLTEGAIRTSLREEIAIAADGDSIDVLAESVADRQIIGALRRAAARGVRVRLLLDPDLPGTGAAAAELLRDGAGRIDVRWQVPIGRHDARYALIRHRNDVWIDLGSASLTRRGLDDFDLDANIELHMPARASPARAATEHFGTAWALAAAYETRADESLESYWRYRVAEATGLAMF